MSKAFTKEGDGGEPDPVVSRRAPLPSGTPNYVTPRGLALLQAELADLEAERAALEPSSGDARRAAWLRLGARITELAERLATAVPIHPPQEDEDRVRFGAHVRVRREDGSESVYQIVGVDEADPKLGRVAFVSPLARALLGKQVGDSAPLASPRGSEELEVLHVAYERLAPPAATPR